MVLQSHKYNETSLFKFQANYQMLNEDGFGQNGRGVKGMGKD